MAISRHKAFNQWRLFSMIAGAVSVAVLVAMTTVDLSTGAGVSSMLQFSVRLAVPWLYIAFAASSLVILFPGEASRWVMRNRRIFGLCFAAGMAWQLFFILWLVVGHFGHYMQEAYYPLDLVEQIPGYIVLIAMTLTSFRFGRRRLTGRQWKILHKSGIWFLWFVVWTTYWFELYYYDDIQLIDYVYYWAGFAAWGARMAAWARQRLPAPAT